MQPEQSSKQGPSSPQKTIANLIDSIDFVKKSKPKSVKSTISISDGESISSHQPEGKEKSKVWTEQQIEMFNFLLKKHGTDFHILSKFFPKKTKNQLKNRYKQYINTEKKKQKGAFKAISLLFKQASEKEEEGQDNKMKPQ